MGMRLLGTSMWTDLSPEEPATRLGKLDLQGSSLHEGGREREGGREGGEGGRERRRKGGREGGREGEKEGGREREGGKEGGRGREVKTYTSIP